MSTSTPKAIQVVSDDEIKVLGFDNNRLQRVREKIINDIELGSCHGVSMIAARKGKVVLDIVEGYAHKENGEMLTSDSVFVTMSVAKQFTNVLALSLVEKGLLKLHAPVAELIPEFATLGKEKVICIISLLILAGSCQRYPQSLLKYLQISKNSWILHAACR